MNPLKATGVESRGATTAALERLGLVHYSNVAPLHWGLTEGEGVEFVAGVDRQPLDHGAIPGCIYAQPQVAWVGMTEATGTRIFPLPSEQTIAFANSTDSVLTVTDTDGNQTISIRMSRQCMCTKLSS